MNSKSFQDQTALTSISVRLRQAENIGLSQQAVAKQQLCSQLSTVRDLEEDHTHPNLVYTFLRGYISSYARLLNIPEEE